MSILTRRCVGHCHATVPRRRAVPVANTYGYTNSQPSAKLFFFLWLFPRCVHTSHSSRSSLRGISCRRARNSTFATVRRQQPRPDACSLTHHLCLIDCARADVGHKGKFGHEFLEFEIRPDGRLRYANNSNYKNDTMIRKEGVCATPYHATVALSPTLAHSASAACRSPCCCCRAVYVGESVLAEAKRIIEESEIVREDDKNWPEPNQDGRQEFEVVIGNQHISFAVRTPCSSAAPPTPGERGLPLLTPPPPAHPCTDGQDRLAARRTRVDGSGRLADLLLPDPGPQMPRLLVDRLALPH